MREWGVRIEVRKPAGKRGPGGAARLTIAAEDLDETAAQIPAAAEDWLAA